MSGASAAEAGHIVEGYMASLKFKLLPVLGLVFLSSIGGSFSVAAQTYPTRTIRLIVPFPAGGSTDVVVRVVVPQMETKLGQRIIVENVSGANGIIGVGRVIQAPPDGYTLLAGIMATQIMNDAMYDLKYDVTRFEAVAPFVGTDNVLYANKSLPQKDIRELIQWMKSHPEELAHGNAAAAPQALAVYFQQVTGAKMRLIPYRGEAPATQDLIAGVIHLMWNSSFAYSSQVSTGQLKAYVTTGTTRLRIAPHLPTVVEIGYPELTYTGWYSLFAPPGTPSDIVTKLNRAVDAAVTDHSARQQLEQMGFDIFPPEERTVEAFGRRVRADREKWWPVSKAANIKVE
jgi:tripartite-type tricarboxylate transporter receptor subunit TctC